MGSLCLTPNPARGTIFLITSFIDFAREENRNFTVNGCAAFFPSYVAWRIQLLSTAAEVLGASVRGGLTCAPASCGVRELGHLYSGGTGFGP